MFTNLTSFKINLFSNQKTQLSKKYFSKIREELLRKKSAQILDIFFFNCIDILNVKEFIECGAHEASASKRLSKKGVKAIAIEANPITFNKLTLPDSNKVQCFMLGWVILRKKLVFISQQIMIWLGVLLFNRKSLITM